VTGAGRGIGRAHAIALARAGAKVVVNDLGVSYGGDRENKSPAASVVAEIRDSGGRAVANESDVATWNGAHELIEQAIDEFGRVDALINNAAIIRPKPLIETSETDFDETIRVNIKGTVLPTRAFAERWSRQPRVAGFTASVVCTTSRVGLFGTPYYLTYGFTKSAVAYFVQAAAAELAPLSIRVNGIAPRADTRMMGDATRALHAAVGDEGLTEVFRAIGTAPPSSAASQSPESVAPLAVWLISDRSRDVTGRIFGSAAGRLSIFNGWYEANACQLAPDHGVAEVEAALRSLLG
jgi:NAD(P)-dependent dehydrogenase (short-subunit alcohol dehydrogenase family)